MMMQSYGLEIQKDYMGIMKTVERLERFWMEI